VLRRTAPRQPRLLLTASPVRVDLPDRSVTTDERPVELSAVEYRLLCHLAGEPTRVLTKVNFELPSRTKVRGVRASGARGTDW
jgi:DNA-binding response OmpR family regulator